ncbi:RsfA family transcriptional regulator [Domibacillus sp. DTU_2020_1001157_1_SI_ALB_TIR_016]|uniref:RsfA family transcriptional regulator n=1 Tax=Domibacillus sp. DTU_2020_1001157_1_SI_ALB_TIR_016 TaxID=3077789 RepID=UPI0028E4D36D|nr:RsfA family transcriptional regulator [Domibacillus sp. DTU_2020_1001157_1_SI_ALB_TIR_016]WNS78478.1 RsfA family transcriptional regulator [Domibacillus sp. DTU_2020_1001157_1_SI_ALB_TIR_016]
MKERQDAWSEENDWQLAETVLRYVREGSTQLKAFEEAGDRLNRTAAACGFRWNAVVRQQYVREMGTAKKQRKDYFHILARREKNIEVADHTVETPAGNSANLGISLAQVISFLTNLESKAASTAEVEQLRKELAIIKEEKAELEKKLEQTQQENITMQEDYETLMRIMNRARQTVLLADNDPSPAFKMEKNGNLEKIAE